MPLHTVCVVIPIYRSELLPSEHLALERCVSVLSHHPITIVNPSDLEIGRLRDKFPKLDCQSFRKDFFSDITGYNRMLLSDEFYARFSNYEFVLIYQLDAFVFSDRLLEWCSRGYDYIGAPWLPKGAPPSFTRRFFTAIRRKLYRLLDIQHRSGTRAHDAQLRYAVGNGGFSLRRVAKMREVLAILDDRAELYRSGVRNTWAEDVFFSVEANRYWRRVKIPSMENALKFAWESNPAVAAQLNKGALPFGCHAWDKLHREEWRPIFQSFGISLDTLLGK